MCTLHDDVLHIQIEQHTLCNILCCHDDTLITHYGGSHIGTAKPAKQYLKVVLLEHKPTVIRFNFHQMSIAKLINDGLQKDIQLCQT